MTLRVVIVMPPVANLAHEVVLDGWPSVVQQATALRDHAGLEVMVACRTRLAAGIVHRNDVAYHFAASDRELVEDVRQWRPDVVHIHGLGFTRLTIRLGRAVNANTRIVLQHHGEPPGNPRTVLGHRLARRYVDGYLFTGALYGQAQPFIDRGMIARNAKCHEVLEAAGTLPPLAPGAAAPPDLIGTPVVLWVGRLIESKDPLTAIAAFALAARELPEAQLHLIATDRALEVPVCDAIAELGALGKRVHLHDPVARDAMRALYRMADIFLSTSRREGSGYALIEAISEGCVPVATAIPSHRAIVGDLARTFPAGDVAVAADLVVAARSIGRDAVLEHATHTLSWSAVSVQLVGAYESARQRRP